MKSRSGVLGVLAAVMLLTAGIAGADIGIGVAWFDNYYMGTPGGDFPGDTWNQLLWSPFNPTVLDPVVAPGEISELDAPGTAYTRPWGTEYLLAAGSTPGTTEFGRYLPGTLGQITYFSTLTGGLNINNGYLYSRIYGGREAELQNMTTWYYQGPVYDVFPLPQFDTTDPGNMNGFEYFGTGTAAGQQGTGVYEYQLVPEPATMALFGLGLAAVAVRARKRS